MIWFNCKKCGKSHNRADNAAGTMIFCDCGNGNTVPWESTAAEPATPPPAVVAPKVPELAPIQFDPTKVEAPPGSVPSKPSSSYPSSTSSSSYDREEEERPYRRGRTEKRDPDYCFNHQRRPKIETCAECEQGFCADCLVKFQGKLMCGPCKNFNSRRQELPPTASTLATASLVISLIAGPLTMCLVLWKPDSDAVRILGFLSLVPQLLALGLGVWALRDAEKENKGGGQWVAITGVGAASLTCVVMVLLNFVASRLV